eukprot:12917253-Prorocentrum_lima.AAC.1
MAEGSDPYSALSLAVKPIASTIGGAIVRVIAVGPVIKEPETEEEEAPVAEDVGRTAPFS